MADKGLLLFGGEPQTTIGLRLVKKEKERKEESRRALWDGSHKVPLVEHGRVVERNHPARQSRAKRRC